ncbi:hypothetical protein CWB96_03390 [Pseudoalteromonas citrea]|uniref:DUF2799 domain-containing protein n=1 Tax=Pseudoalteromonas citrea TaxID=43655 RepID=A0A5S3XTC2_9GAMM|nr:DUF2799 domain-containing protein [Pseudoalteromonas citrea]TMP43160.1 hypothetical protein CWB97_09775 [Pseudoalteromonas citrea]TMP61701.1 hypothetical protein CWB96_03390 [Pseudoalteromonas citrea]
MKLLSIPLLLLLTACNSSPELISKDRCGTEDWKSLGYKTALNKKSVKEFDSVKLICGQKVAANVQELFVDGYSDGLIKYCTYETGFNTGKQGLALGKFCPPELQKNMMLGYRRGKQLRDQNQLYIEEEKRISQGLTTQNGLGNQ